MKAPFLISPPRTRSSILYYTMAEYVQKKHGLMLIQNHSELFLEYNQSLTITDHKSKSTHPGEMIPFLGESISMHSVYPYVFQNLKERNMYKLNMLKEAKSQGKNFYFKGTFQVSETAEEIIDFFSDRHFVITKRRNTLDQLCSLLFAKHHRMFIVFDANAEHVKNYKSNVLEGAVITDFERVARYVIEETQKLYALEEILQKKNLEYSVAYYEDMNTWDNIIQTAGKILGDSEWRHTIPNLSPKNMPMNTEVDYSKTIKNYTEVKSKLLELIEEYEFYV